MALMEASVRLGLIDVTIKVYDSIFFMFFIMRPSLSQVQVEAEIHEAMEGFGSWGGEFLFNAVYDLQEEYIRKELEKMGFEWESG